MIGITGNTDIPVLNFINYQRTAIRTIKAAYGNLHDKLRRKFHVSYSQECTLASEANHFFHASLYRGNYLEKCSNEPSSHLSQPIPRNLQTDREYMISQEIIYFFLEN